MSSTRAHDRQSLIAAESDNPPTYQDATNPEYGTFTSPYATRGVSPYPYAFGPEPPVVIIVGGCPACRVGMLESEFTCCGLCCAVLFFPIGILCCLACRQRRCNFCGAIFD